MTDVPTYLVRECRGHWHVGFLLKDGEFVDLAIRGDIERDQFTKARADEVAALLNSDPTKIDDFD